MDAGNRAGAFLGLAGLLHRRIEKRLAGRSQMSPARKIDDRRVSGEERVDVGRVSVGRDLVPLAFVLLVPLASRHGRDARSLANASTVCGLVSKPMLMMSPGALPAASLSACALPSGRLPGQAISFADFALRTFLLRPVGEHAGQRRLLRGRSEHTASSPQGASPWVLLRAEPTGRGSRPRDSPVCVPLDFGTFSTP